MPEKMTNDDLENTLAKIDLSEKTEMGEVAQHIFQKGAGRTNLTDEQVALCLINKLVFKGLQLEELDPTDVFMELMKSKGGWSTEKFVQGLGGMNNQRAGGIGTRIIDGLFSRKPPTQ